MRDLSRYPLQEAEILAWLHRQMERYLETPAFGALDGVIIQRLIKRVEALEHLERLDRAKAAQEEI